MRTHHEQSQKLKGVNTITTHATGITFTLYSVNYHKSVRKRSTTIKVITGCKPYVIKKLANKHEKMLNTA